jgi:hypothetical protein
MPVLPDWTAVDRVQANPGGGAVSYRPNQGPDVGAGIQAGRDLQQAAAIIAESNQRQDTVLAQSKANDLARVRAKLEYDPNGGLRSVQGEGVTKPEFVETYTQKFKDASQTLRDTLTSDSQKAMFDRHVEVQGLQYQSSLLQHQAVETKRFNDQTDNDTVKMAINATSQDPANVLTYATSVKTITDAVSNYARRNGLSKESSDELLATSRSAAVVARIKALANGIPGVVEPNPDEALALFKTEQPSLTDAARKDLTSDLLHAGVADKVQKMAPAYANMTLKEAQAALDADTTMPAMLKTALRSEIEHRHAAATASLAQEAQTVSKSAWAALMKTGNINAIDRTLMSDLRRLAPEEERQMRDWVDAKYRQGKADRENKEDPDEMGRFYTYFRMATESPESQAAFKKLQLEKIIPLVSKAHWSHLVQLQGSIEKGDDKSMNENLQYQQTVKMIDSVMKKAGIDTTPKEGSPQAVVYDNFKGALVMSLKQAQAAHPEKPLTADQMKKIGLEMLQTRIEQGSGVGGWFRTNKLGYEIVNDPKAAGKNWIAVPYSEIPPAIRSQLDAQSIKGKTFGGMKPEIDKELVERMYQIGRAEGRF